MMISNNRESVLTNIADARADMRRHQIEHDIDRMREELCARMRGYPLWMLLGRQHSAENLIRCGMPWQKACDEIYPIPDGVA